jgi:hypothetical protein
MISPSASGDRGIAGELNEDRNIMAGDMGTPPLSERDGCSLLFVRSCREMSWSRSEPGAVWDAAAWCSPGILRDGSLLQAKGRLSCPTEERESDSVVVAGARDLMRPEVMEKILMNER